METKFNSSGCTDYDPVECARAGCKSCRNDVMSWGYGALWENPLGYSVDANPSTRELIKHEFGMCSPFDCPHCLG